MSKDTKRLIAATAFQLFERNSAYEITVQDIADAAGIARQTFYYHFKDLAELIRWGTEQFIRQTIEESADAPDAEYAARCFLRKTLRYRALFAKIAESSIHDDALRKLEDALRLLFDRVIKERGLYASETCETQSTIVTFYVCAVLGVLTASWTQVNKHPTWLTRDVERLLAGEFVIK